MGDLLPAKIRRAAAVVKHVRLNMVITDVGLVVGTVPLYGTGALFIREAVRRSGRGWPAMLACPG
ncbi:hypothetical protein ABZ912_12745 [Nonomuraea angiospora]|uniref:hypothetical protein n=1 Tax=Nonomuraea angiospora TaxID=46172 RepID=UPI0033EDA7F4